MITLSQRVSRLLLCLVTLAILSSAMVGCEYFPESTFKLANESRLPRWFSLPPGHSRSDVSITLNYYSNLWGKDATFILYDGKGHVLGRIDGKEKNSEPLHLKSSPTGYPLFEVITANGITEIIEHKRMEPIFYITDDPSVWREFTGVQPLAVGPVISPR
jgi:hypothetical protein